MLYPLVRSLFRWFVFCITLALAGGALTCCGSVTQGKNGRLSIRLELPAGEDPALFWFGVSSRSLKIGDGKGDSQIVPWVEGQAPELDVREGDQIEFCGADERGRLLVSGSATVGGENSLTIPLRRVL